MSGEQKKLLLAGTVYLGIGICVASYLGTWTDEEYSLATTSHGIVYAIHRAISFELQAPLYFAILAAWRAIDASVWFARLFSLLCATALFFVLARIAKRVAPEFDPIPFAAIVAINPFVAYAAFEIRLYALALLVSALLWLAFYAGYGRGSDGRARAAFVLLAVFGVYVQYFLAFMLVGFGCSLLVLRRFRVLLTYALHAGIVAVAVLPLALLARGQVGGYETSGPSVGLLVRATAVHPALDFLFPYDQAWSATPHVRAAYLLVVALCALTVLLSRPQLSRELWSYAACAAVIDAVYVAMAVLLRVELNDRYFVALFVPVSVTAYALFRAVWNGRNPRFALVFVPGALLTLLALFSQYRFLAQAGDWKRVAPYVSARAIAGDVIAVYPPDGIPAFEREYRGPIPVVGFPRPFSTQQYSVSNVSVDSETQARVAFAKLGKHRHIWFIDDVPCIPSPLDYGCHFVENVIGDEFHVVDRAEFYKATVLELSRLPSDLTKSKSSR